MDDIKLIEDTDHKNINVDNNFEGSVKKNNNIRINKVPSKNSLLNQSPKTSSNNANVNIGLDLIANIEKKRPIKSNEKSNETPIIKKEENNLDSGYDLNNLENNNIEEFDLLNEQNIELNENINLEQNSTLNDAELEELVDQQDQNNQGLYNKSMDDNIINNNFEKISILSDSGKSKNFQSPGNISINQNLNTFPHVVRNSPKPKSYRDIEAERNEKQDLLMKFEKMRRLGIPMAKRFNYSSNIDEMRFEFKKIKAQRDSEKSVAFQKKMLMACVTGLEFLNNKFDPFDVKLDGWSESIHENINDYNEVFEELHEKYSDRAKMAPELKLLFMVGGSAFMFHLTNTMFKSQLPGMGDIMRQNPELMKQFANAAMNSMSGETQSAARMFSNHAPGFNQGPQMQQQYNNVPHPNKTQYQQVPNQYQQAPNQYQQTPNQYQQAPNQYQQNSRPISTPFNNPTNKPRRSSTKIEPPSGVDDLLAQLQSNTDDVSDKISVNSSNSFSRKNRSRRSKNVTINIGK